MATKSSLTRFMAWTTLLAIALCFPAITHAEGPIKTDQDASSAKEFIGEWDVVMDMMGRKMNFLLKVIDMDGLLGATIDSQMMPEPAAIEEISLNDDNAIVMGYEMKFGAQAFNLTITGALNDDGFGGEITEASGLFKAPFTAKEALDDPETNEQRRRNRRGAATAAKLRFGKQQVNISFPTLKAESKDHEAFAALADGQVFEYVGGRASKLLTDVDMHFNGFVAAQGNAHPTYPGVYGIWIKKDGDGYNLVFNQEADVWGTMFNEEMAIGETPLTVSKAEEAAATYKVTLEKNADETGGTLKILWGDTVFSAEFKAEKKEEKPSV
jgi:hypothetical protein